MATPLIRKAQRTMFIGLGGTGNEVVRRIKREMLYHGYNLPIFQYLVLDTVPFHEDPGMPPLMRLRNGEEYLYIGGYNPNEILKRIDNWPVISRWWGTRDQTNLVTVDEGAGQMRAVGRMGFFRNFTAIQARLERMVREVMSSNNRESALFQNYDVSTSKPPVIYLVFSLCGGTGSSLFFDVAYVLRKLLDIKPTIVGLAILPGPFIQDIYSIPQQERIQANTYAALQELELLHNIALGQVPRLNGVDIWDVQYATNFRVSSPDLPFEYIYLIDDTTSRGERYTREQIYELTSQAIFWLSGPSTAALFWERAKNLTSNTLAGGGRPDLSGNLRLPKYSSFGVSTAALDWRLERVQHELEYLILSKIRAIATAKPTLPNWLSSAEGLINKIGDEPGINPIPSANVLKPSGTFRDRASVDEMLENHTTKYEAAIATLPRSLKWQRCKDGYRKMAIDELDAFFHKSLIERGPTTALQEMEMIKEGLDAMLKKLDELEGNASQQEANYRNAYEQTRRTLEPENGFVQAIGSFVSGVRKLYGFKNKTGQRNLRILAENAAHQRYLWYSERFHMYLCRDVAKNVLEPALTHAERLRASLEDIDDSLQGWQDRIQQEDLSQGGGTLPNSFEKVIRIRPQVSERTQIDDAIKRGDIKPDQLVGKVLKQAFDTWPKPGGNALADLRAALVDTVSITLQRLRGQEHLITLLCAPEAWKQRELFLQRAECMWSFVKDATQEVLSHLESINMLGYGVDLDTSGHSQSDEGLNAQMDVLLKQQETAPERVPTEISSELMLMKTTHGLPISFIRSMPELHQAYQVMNLVRAAPYLHLDYRDQVRAGYGPLTEIEMAAQQIVDNWTAVADDIEQTMSGLAPEIRDAVAEYEKKRQYVLQETVQVSNERDALFDFVGAIEETIATQNKTPVVIEALTELSNLTGLLHAQGWVAINPPHGAQVDQILHEVVGARNEPGLPADRIVEVRQRGYIRRRPNLGSQIRRAKVIVSSSTAPDVSQHLTVKMP